MTSPVYALGAACLWFVAANVIAMLPSRDRHWRAAYALIAVGIPILGWVTYAAGPFWGLLVFAGGTSVLRWPLIHLWRALRRSRKEPAE
ncbi:MAG: DUF2484 family protein [Pseudomonadota bacterium]|jgi:hypothetical protein